MVATTSAAGMLGPDPAKSTAEPPTASTFTSLIPAGAVYADCPVVVNVCGWISAWVSVTAATAPAVVSPRPAPPASVPATVPYTASRRDQRARPRTPANMCPTPSNRAARPEDQDGRNCSDSDGRYTCALQLIGESSRLAGNRPEMTHAGHWQLVISADRHTRCHGVDIGCASFVRRIQFATR